MKDQVLKNFNEILTLSSAYKKDGRNLTPSDIDLIQDGAVVVKDGKIEWVGESLKIPSRYNTIPAVNYSGICLTPELVDSHTHLVFAGDRSQEYVEKINGADYEAIAKMGGGILASQRAIASSTSETLFLNGKEKIKRFFELGIGSLEIKSGYGLTFKSELMISEIIEELKKYAKSEFDLEIFNTFLAAHAVPGEYASSHDYLQDVVCPLLDYLVPKKIIDAVDIFQERGYFDHKDVVTLFEKAKSFKIPVKIHADEFQDNGGAGLAVDYKALSADHLMKTSDIGIEALAKSDTVATLLPGTSFFLGKDLANGKKFLDKGCKVAIASDYNPGSCHCDNLLFLASLAAPQYKMNIAQLWASITLNAAAALGKRDQGAIVKGMKPRFTMFKCRQISEIPYSWGNNLVFRP